MKYRQIELKSWLKRTSLFGASHPSSRRFSPSAVPGTGVERVLHTVKAGWAFDGRRFFIALTAFFDDESLS